MTDRSKEIREQALALEGVEWTWDGAWLRAESLAMQLTPDSTDETRMAARLISLCSPAEMVRLTYALGRARDLRADDLVAIERQAVEMNRMATDARLGAAVRRVSDQVNRLRWEPCPTMKYGTGPAAVANAARSEIDELEAEAIGSDAAHREVADLFGATIHLAKIHGAPLAEILDELAVRLCERNDEVARGGTWAGAKAREGRSPITINAEIIERRWATALPFAGDHIDGAHDHGEVGRFMLWGLTDGSMWASADDLGVMVVSPAIERAKARERPSQGARIEPEGCKIDGVDVPVTDGSFSWTNEDT